MISAIFVDRPRLAIVISIVITIAGLLAIRSIPVAQFPAADSQALRDAARAELDRLFGQAAA